MFNFCQNVNDINRAQSDKTMVLQPDCSLFSHRLYVICHVEMISVIFMNVAVSEIGKGRTIPLVFWSQDLKAALIII